MCNIDYNSFKISAQHELTSKDDLTIQIEPKKRYQVSVQDLDTDDSLETCSDSSDDSNCSSDSTEEVSTSTGALPRVIAPFPPNLKQKTILDFEFKKLTKEEAAEQTKKTFAAMNKDLEANIEREELKKKKKADRKRKLNGERVN